MAAWRGRSTFTMPEFPTRQAPDPNACAVARAVGEARSTRRVEELYGDSISVDLIRMSEGAFHDGRRARNHVAGQAVRDGFNTNGDKVNYDNPEPTNWPDVQQRIARTICR